MKGENKGEPNSANTASEIFNSSSESIFDKHRSENGKTRILSADYADFRRLSID
jgi:hypothetical protein